MNDYAYYQSLDELKLIEEYSFEATAPMPNEASYTVCFWFWAESFNHKQIIAGQGNLTDNQPGWQIYLMEGLLYVEVITGDLTNASFATYIGSTTDWHHVTLVLDRENACLQVYLDGERRTQHTPLPSAAIQAGANLVIGGYTDPAGGHYDYTFGRGGSGLVDDFRIYTRALDGDETKTFIQANTQPPTAHITVKQKIGDAPVTVRFNANKSTGTIRAYLWDFGDGHTGYGIAPEHNYAYAGSYSVRLTVVGDGYIQVTTKYALMLTGQENPVQMTPVFVNGEEGYGCYRIPAIVRAANGDLVAFAEGRVETCSDSTENIHAVCKRSSDNGQTWQPLQVVSRNPLSGKISVVQNISPVIDTVHGTGRIIVVYNKAEYSEWDITAGTGVIQTFVIFSDDHGITWHSETNITQQVHRPYVPDYTHIYADAALPENRLHDWRMHRPTLGHGLQCSDGRLLFVGAISQGSATVFQSQNIVFGSHDLGQSWHIDGVIPRVGMNEASAVELEDGSIMLNTRAYHNQKPLGFRAVIIGAFSPEGHMAFETTYPDTALVDSAVQATIIRYTRSDEAQFGGKSRLLFANPAHPHARRVMTVRLSYDEGQTWAVSKIIDPGPSAYSDLVIQQDMRMGLLYERGNQGGITYASFSLDWLTDGKDRLSL